MVDLKSFDNIVPHILDAEKLIKETVELTKVYIQDKDVEILVSISPKMYPFGIKDVVKSGDFPIVWTNKRYRMIYLNMGHGDESFMEATQNLLYTNAFRWVVSCDPKGNPFEK